VVTTGRALALAAGLGWWAPGLPAQAGLSVAGVGLTDSPAVVRQALGPPERREASLGLEFWVYGQRGVELVWDRDRWRLTTIVLRKPGSGSVEAVRVGDSTRVVRARWGAPARARQGHRYLDFVRAQWVQTVEIRDGTVVEITVAVKQDP
jgi:hypothetical protein